MENKSNIHSSRTLAQLLRRPCASSETQNDLIRGRPFIKKEWTTNPQSPPERSKHPDGQSRGYRHHARAWRQGIDVMLFILITVGLEA